MSEKINKLFSPDGHIPEEMLLRYAGKQLSPAEEHRVERHALHCELCSDTMEGLMYAKHPEKLPEIISNIQKEIQHRTAPKIKIVRMNTRTVLSMAAGLALVCTLGYFMLQQGGDQMAAPNTSEELKKAEEVMTPPKADDSSGGVIVLEEPTEILNRKKTITVQEEVLKNETSTLSTVTKEGEVFSPPAPVQDNSVVNGEGNGLDDLFKEKNKDLPNKLSDKKDVDSKTEKDEQSDADIIVLQEKQKQENSYKTDKKPTDKVVGGKNQKKSKTRAVQFDEPKKVSTHPDPSPNMVIVDENKANQNVPNNVNVPNTTTIVNTTTTNAPQSTSGYNYLSNLDSVSVSTNGTYFELGSKYYDKNSMDTAIVYLEKIKNVPPYAKYEEARWKLAQAYLKKNEKVKAKAILEELSKGKGVYKKPAADKLKELK